MLKICNKVVEYSFYALFALVPLAFTSATSELFEMNKMWLVWILTIIIAMSWIIKMVLQKKILFCRTPLDIPIGLFLLSQVISTIFSLDPHVSLWGYYSRFNGGLLSIISYILLYYAFLSNFDKQKLLSICHKLLAISLISGLIVALWGLPSHFGYDPTCLVFRGTFDVSCWTADFMPKIRIFSTLGQPDWLAAYLAILMPISIVMAIDNLPSQIKINGKMEDRKWKMEWLKKTALPSIFYILLSALFYVDILFTRARSGFVGIWLSLIFFAVAYFWMERKKTKFPSLSTLKSPLSIFIIVFLLITFIIGAPIAQLSGLTVGGISGFFQKTQAPKTPNKTTPTPTPVQSFELGGTESGNIRLLVWEGALNAWKNNPIFGTGVETFAFAYYKYKPIGQNLTSEWNFLYNKAHNEYLNYLATTGIVGLGTYLSIIFIFLWLSIKYLVSSIKEKTQNTQYLILNTALLTSYISILITNFFGFSVVIANIYLFLIPAFIFVFTGQAEIKSAPTQVNSGAKIEDENPVWQWTPIVFTLIIGSFMLFSLVRFWQADIAFALGYNLDRAGEYQQAYPNLHKAVQIRGGEPVFKDELSINDAIVAAALISQKTEDEKAQQQSIQVASSLAQEAIDISNEVISQHPNNVVFWKTRVRIFYTLSQVDARYLPRALDAIEKASLIAPNDANISYNLGVLYGQNNNIDKGISVLENTIILKPNYKDAHFGLGLFYHQKAIDANGKVIDSAFQQKAIAQIQYILTIPGYSKDADALASIENWAK